MDVLDENGQALYGSVGELISMAGCYDFGDTEEDRAEAHSQWTLASKELMTDSDRERMRRKGAADTPTPNRKANTAEQTAAELAAIEHELRLSSDGGCDGNGAGGKWGASGWGVHVSSVSADGSLIELADLFGPVVTDAESQWFMGASRGTNNTGELSGFGQSLYWLRDVDRTTRTAVILYDSMWAHNMIEGNWKPDASVAMIRRLQAVLADVRTRRQVFFVHVKSHQDDGVRLHDITDTAVLSNIRADKLVGWGKSMRPYSRLRDGGAEGNSVDAPSPQWPSFWSALLNESRAKVAAITNSSAGDGSSVQNSARAGRSTDVGVSRSTEDARDGGQEEGMLDDADLAELEELDQEMRFLAELDAMEQVRDEDDSSSLSSSDEEERRREDEETPVLHALKAAVPARAAPPPPHVGLTDLRGADVASREDSVAQVAALRASADMSGLTAAVDRWSAGEPAVGSFEDPDSVCEIVTLPEPTGESRNRSRGLHVLITKS